jgi:hypothetical protein
VQQTNWRGYLKATRDEIFDRLSEIYQELSGLHVEIAMVHVAEKRAKVDGYARSQDPAVTARTKDGEVNAIELTATVLQLAGQIEALQCERDLLLLLLRE